MCPKPSIPKAQQYQTQQDAVLPEGEEEAAARRGRRGTILASAMGSSDMAPSAAGGKTKLGQ